MISAEAIAEQARRALELEERSKREKREQQHHRVVRRRTKKAAASPEAWLTGKRVTDQKTADDEQLKFFDESRGLPRFRDDDGMHWWITNHNAAGERVRDFMSLEIVTRVFENAAGVRKIYRFLDSFERRELAVKHLERQLREAKIVDG